MQTWRWTDLLQMLRVTITGEVYHLNVLMFFCGSTSQVDCRATFSSTVALGVGWSLWYFSSMAAQT